VLPKPFYRAYTAAHIYCAYAAASASAMGVLHRRRGYRGCGGAGEGKLTVSAKFSFSVHRKI